ncbi:MBL fold metallo-hydrolase [Devosia sp. CN2-171]|jgi:flavorubredoxin|uniref:MBL fold metallo-hydrolase n=1 Tax=Devosia sp. CN2-171 TaxID=3400909 RepID=UPI003BF85C2E
MDTPSFIGASKVAPDTTSFRSFAPIPGLGILPINAHLIHAKEPVLVDTSWVGVSEAYLDALQEVIDPADLRWIWISHTDLDHVFNLEAVMKLAPNAKVVIAGLGAAKFGLRGDFDMTRLHVLEAGQRLDVGDRELVSVKPVIYDAPETNGFFDTKTRVLFSADAFGALLDGPREEVADIPESVLREGQTAWASVDAPWLGWADKSMFGALLSDIEKLDPSTIISGHLPATSGPMIHKILGNLVGAMGASRFGGPDRETIEGLFAAPAGVL